MNTIQEAGELTRGCARAVSAVPRTLCLLLGLLCTASPGQAAGFNFASLQSLLAQQDIGSVEELIAALPPAQRNRYALVFDSRSLQGASLENPRVILYGPDARFIVTFNGSPAQRGFRVVETMEFDAATKEFRLRELLFPERAGGVDKVVVSEADPQRCARCHGAPARPVWDTFPLWPGAYGERYRNNLSARERAGLSAFLAQQPTHPRYRQLLGANRFADPQTFRSNALGQYAGIPQEPPNAELAVYLSRLQAQSIARQLVQQPAFDAYRYALVGLADNACGRLADFYSDSLWHSRRQDFERFARNTALANARQAQLKAARAAITGGGALAPQSTTSDNALVQLRFVAESALGVATQNWTLALEQGTYDFTLPPLPAQPLRETLVAEVATRDAVIQDLSRYSTSSDGDRFCSYLKRRSRATLTASSDGAPGVVPLNPTAPLSRAAVAPVAGAMNAPAAAIMAPPAALQLCVSCHETGVAPLLPFSDPTQLTQQLRVRPSAHGTLIDEIRFRLSAAAGAHQMPLGLNLSDADRDSLAAYFAALAASPD